VRIDILHPYHHHIIVVVFVIVTTRTTVSSASRCRHFRKITRFIYALAFRTKCPLGIVISVFDEIKFVVRFVHVRYRVISLPDGEITLVISITQIYGGKVARREDGALPVQRHDGKSVRLRFHSTSSFFKFTRVYHRNRIHIYPQKL